MIGVVLLVSLVSLLTYLVMLGRRVNRHWAEREVVHLQPVLFFGNRLWTVIGNESNTQLLARIRAAFPGQSVVGFYDFMTPRLLILDADLVQRILIKDFAYFTDHGVTINPEKNPTDEQLFFMNGSKWRAFRIKLSPIFTTGKLKEMYSIMKSIGENLLHYLRLREREEVEAKTLMELYSIDVISSAVFGVDPASLKEPESEYVRMARQINNTGFGDQFRIFLYFSFPKLMSRLGVAFQSSTFTSYFMRVIQSTLDVRRSSGRGRNDLIQMMIQLKEKGEVEVKNWDAGEDDYLKMEGVGPTEKIEMNDDNLMAQALGFMFAGFSATTFAMAFAAFEMTQHLDLQDRVREEVRERAAAHGGITYQALKEMNLLEGVIKETLRLYSLAPYLFRVCNKRYELPNGLVIEKGEEVSISILSVHLDPNNFPEPTAFKPERFLEPIKPGTYLPFGEGPRICIAMRYAMLVMKYGLALLYQNYRTTLSPRTKVPLPMNNRLFSPLPKEKIWLKLEKV